MQYVRNLSDSVSTAWNSINPATLSGAIDVIVVEQEDGSYSCSPFHVRFGKFSLLRPSDKKVEFTVNGIKQEYSMKLGEGGEAFFVFETTDNIPKSMQTSPLVSPAQSPSLEPEEGGDQGEPLQEPDMLELDRELSKPHRPPPSVLHSQPDTTNEHGVLTPLSTSPNFSNGRPVSGDWSNSIQRPHSDDILRRTARATSAGPLEQASDDDEETLEEGRERSMSPPPLAPKEAVERAHIISKALLAANIPSDINETGDIMLDMTSFKSSEDDMLRAEIVARKILSEKLDGNYDIGALFGFDAEGNLWIYSSEEARQAAMKKTMEASLPHHHPRRSSIAADAASDPGYHSDSSDATAAPPLSHGHRRAESDAGPMDLQTPPRTPTGAPAGDPNRNYAKTLRLTSEQLKDLDLRPGENSMSFTVNRATCTANMYLWKHETPVVISDIDGTITKSDALGHVLNMIGRDWTHSGVAKLYTDIAQNGYNIMYLTSRSVGQADTTRQYLYNIVQDGYRLPHGPTILSPDRTMAALRREIYLRKPHVFKMATLRDIRNLYGPDRTPFTAGFGNRLTDQISYRTVDVPRNRIFTINSNAEVSLDLLSLNKLKMSYVNINEVVDHYFPPVNTLVKGGGEEYTDFKYWRDEPLDLDAFSASGSDDDGDDDADDGDDDEDDDVGDDQYSDNDEEVDDALADSYISRDSYEDAQEGSVLSNSIVLDDQRGSTNQSRQRVYHEETDEDDDGPASEDETAAYKEELAAQAARNSTEKKRAKRRSDQRTGVVEDESAEIITGQIENGVVPPSKRLATTSSSDGSDEDEYEDEDEEEDVPVQEILEEMFDAPTTLL